MTRREFLTTTSAAALGAGLASPSATQGAAMPPGPLPATQSGPKPELGTHWSNVFEKLSARCQPRMSFLNEAFTDPQAWVQQARATLLADPQNRRCRSIRN